MYVSLLLICALFLGWAHTHTDEIPVVLGFVLLVSAGVGIAFPRRVILTIPVLGLSVFCAETLVHFEVLRAPYPASAGLPWPALLAFLPAAAGAGVGAALRAREN